MKKSVLLLLIIQVVFFKAIAQYAPQAGIAGSSAVHATSIQIVGWASGCTVQRGYLDIAQPSLGNVSSGAATAGAGSADNFVVSLGDSGIATLTFSNPIVNGTGPDFAVFENGFLNAANSEEAFLELAFVEVSSDGINFFRFPSVSLTQDTSQLSSVVGQNYMNARLLYNLAGKYISNYGTPFDLQELAGIPALDVNHIVSVRIVDVIGSVEGHSSFDALAHKINDPYPTAFPTGGFDLDAVGVIHQAATSAVIAITGTTVTVYPNPSTDVVHIRSDRSLTITLTDAFGKILKNAQVDGTVSLPLTGLASGIYFLNFVNEEGVRWAERLYKY